VPLPNGRSIPVTLTHKQSNNQDKELAALRAEIAELRKQQEKSSQDSIKLQIKIAVYLKKIADLTEKSDIIGTPPIREGV
jgi:hypothetical protein